MKYCQKCGTQIDENINFCPKCGNPVKDSYSDNQDFSNKFESFVNTPDLTSHFAPTDIENNKIWAVLSYFFILFILPLIIAPKSRFARFHANQGLVLFIFSTAYSIVQGILNTFLYAIGLDLIAQMFKLVGLLFFALFILGIVNAATGKAKELPIIGKIKIITY